MEYTEQVVKGQFVKRYKRFFADVMVGDNLVVAHVANTGSMRSCLAENAPVVMTHTTDPKRKLKYSLQQIQLESSWIGVNTAMANTLVKEVMAEKSYSDWAEFDQFRAEVKINAKTRLDFALWDGEETKFSMDRPNHFVEVKSVTLVEGKQALFPDTKSERAQKHLLEMMELIKLGHTTEVAFVVQRTDATTFSPAKEYDPAYADLFWQAKEEGVKFSVFTCDLNDRGIKINPSNQLPVKK